MRKYIISVLLCFLVLEKTTAQEHDVVDYRSLSITQDSVLTISLGDQPLLQYNFQTAELPTGVDPLYARAGYIHPLYTRQGHRLTQIQPKDHYHHYGLWNAWTHTLIDQDTVDFWNLAKRSGAIYFVQLIDQAQFDNQVQYTTLHRYHQFRGDQKGEAVLEERQTVSVQIPDQKDYYTIDITIELTSRADHAVRLLRYRYGGFGWRAHEYWNGTNSKVVTSEGRQRDDSDGTRVRWVKVEGKMPSDDYAGMTIFSHPRNFNHPEPLRVWDSASNAGKSNLFINITPTRDRDRLISPGETFTLKYRLLIFDGQFNQEDTEKQWKQFIQNVN